MATVSMQLLNVLGLKSEIAYAERELIRTASKAEEYTKQAQKYAKYEEAWNSDYEECYYSEKKVTYKGVDYYNENEDAAAAYADAKTPQRNLEIYEELTDLQVDYETQQTLWETALEYNKNLLNNYNQNLSTSTQDTGLLNGGG